MSNDSAYQEAEPSRSARLATAAARISPKKISFNRKELDQILSLYGFFVAAGEWRDYAIDSLTEAAVFSIYRRASEEPLYRVEKRPHMAKRQGAFSVMAPAGLILRRGNDLGTVLRVFDRKKLRLAV